MSLSYCLHSCVYSGQGSNKCWCYGMQILALGMRVYPEALSIKTLHMPFSQDYHAKRLGVSLRNSPSRKQLPVTELRISPRACVTSSFVPVLPLKRTLIRLLPHPHPQHTPAIILHRRVTHNPGPVVFGLQAKACSFLFFFFFFDSFVQVLDGFIGI